MVESARRTAWQTLVRIDHDGAFANLVLPSVLDTSGLSRLDKAFVTDLVYGTTRRRRSLDAVIDRFITAEPEPDIRTLLRLGTYQLLMTRTPPHAAVNGTVELAPRRVRGFVNAVLRRISALSPNVSWSSEAEELSYPDWIVDLFHREMDPGEARAALEMMNRPAAMTVRSDGYVQDLSSQWVTQAVGARPGELVLDLCAGPGGKATGLARSDAHVVAADVQVHRARLVAENARRLGITLDVVVADGCRPPFQDGMFDRVLLDAPCSGLGALRRRADARWRIQESDVTELAALQDHLLRAAAPLVRPGGVLIYSVCTITAAESIDHPVPGGMIVVGRHGDDSLPALDPIWKDFGSGHRILPHHHQPTTSSVASDESRDEGSGTLADGERSAGSDGMTMLRYRRRP